MKSDREIRVINQKMIDQDLANAFKENRELKHKNNSLSMENANLKSQLRKKDNTISDYKQSDLEKMKANAELRKENQFLNGLIRRFVKNELTPEDLEYLQKQKLLELEIEEMLKQGETQEVIIDSTNSSLPPSSDEIRQLGKKGSKKTTNRSNKYNGREKTGRKKGGQEGREGTTLTMGKVLKMVEDGLLEAKYETIGEIDSSKKPVKRIVLDLEIKPVAKVYTVYGEIPKELTKPVTYGSNVRGLTVLLSTEGLVAEKRLANIINGLSNNVFSISEGSIHNFLEKFTNDAEPELQEIIKDLINGKVLYTDSTKFETRESVSYVRNHSNNWSVYFIPTLTKTIAELSETEILPNFYGILVHDHETGMYHFALIQAECHSHDNRDLRRIIDETGHQWAKDLLELFNSTNEKRKKLIKKGIDHFEPEEIEKIENSVIEIIKSGYIEYENETRNVDQEMELRVLKRFTNVKYRAAYELFLHDFDVEFTNNKSERDIRKVVNKRKDIKKFGNIEGLERFCKLLSLSETLKKRDVPQFTKFCEIIKRNAPNL